VQTIVVAFSDRLNGVTDLTVIYVIYYIYNNLALCNFRALN
jgi:hypothetical protein